MAFANFKYIHVFQAAKGCELTNDPSAKSIAAGIYRIFNPYKLYITETYPVILIFLFFWIE